MNEPLLIRIAAVRRTSGIRRDQQGAMIHYLSIAAREPERVAGVLAELMGGLAVPDTGNFLAGDCSYL